MNTHFLWILVWIACLHTAVAQQEASRPPQGLRVFTCGHSFHAWVAAILDDMARSAGIHDHVKAGVSSIGGSKVIQHWEVPLEKNIARHQLAKGKVDVLTLSPIWLPDEGIENFARHAAAHNPEARVLVQEFWLPNDTYNPVYPLDVRKVVDHNAATVEGLREQNDLYRKDIEDHVAEINKKLGKKVVYVVPVGEATIALREKIIAGKAPGLKVQWRLFKDSWGHPTVPLRVLAAYCHYAVIYRRSPVGLPMPAEFVNNQEYASEALNRLLQELAWQAVISNPMTGVTESSE